MAAGGDGTRAAWGRRTARAVRPRKAEKRDREGKGRGRGKHESLRQGPQYPHRRNGTLDSGAPAGPSNPRERRESRVAQNRGSVARRGPKEEGSGREPEERGGRTRLKKQNWAPRDPRAQVTGFPWTAWKCRWQPAPWLSADVRLAPDPHQLLTSGGANAPPAAGTPPGAQRLSGACTLSTPCPAGPARPATSDQRRSALLCAPVPRPPGFSPTAGCARLRCPLGKSREAGKPLGNTGPLSETA